MGKSVVAPHSGTQLTIVVDDACPVVHKLGWLVRQWDKQQTFRFVGNDAASEDRDRLLELLGETSWSLMLIDAEGQIWRGPDAIPFILKNLPSGKIAAVAYTVPGTMWLTKQLYLTVSRNRRLLKKNSNSHNSNNSSNSQPTEKRAVA